MTTELLEDVAAGRAPSLVPLTVEQFHEMIKAGIVPDGSPIELIDGFMVYKDRGAAGDKTSDNTYWTSTWRRYWREAD